MNYLNHHTKSNWIVQLFLLIFLISSSKAASINVNVDPRIELLSVIQIISDYHSRYYLMTNYDFEYKHDVIDYFSQYKDHQAVKLFDKMSHLPYGFFNFHRPPELMIHPSDPPGLLIQHSIPKAVITSSDLRTLIPLFPDMARLIEFIDALRNFYIETDFMNFYDKHIEFYRTVSADVKDELSQFDINELEEYFGIRQNSYNIVLAPLFHDGGFATKILLDDGKYDIYSIIGPTDSIDGKPSFGDYKRLTKLCLHEYNHSFIELETNYELFKPYRSLYNPIKKQMKANAYPNWMFCVEEHIVRAVVIRLISKELGEEVGADQIEQEINHGFIYISGICDKLKQFENQRDLYPTLVDFYPEIAKVFK